MALEIARADKVYKRYGDVVAVSGSSLSIQRGKLHAVCGENGAGKSTLLKIVAGIVVPDDGRVEVFGSPLAPHVPAEAIARGVAMVLQHFALVPGLSVLENIILGAEPSTRLGTLDKREARRMATDALGQLGIELPLDVPVDELGVGDKQRLEITRAVYRKAKLLILDEPTAVLTRLEVDALYRTLKTLADAGAGVVVVTHKLDEVRDYADQVTVMRRGEVVLSQTPNGSAPLDVDAVSRAIMGATDTAVATEAEPLAANPHAVGDGPKEVLLSVSDVRQGTALHGVSLRLHAGEILGIAGVEGNGQVELVEVLARAVKPDLGTVSGADVVVVREDRQTSGLVLDASVRDNLVLGELATFANALGILDLPAIERESQSRLHDAGARGALDDAARALSGGNQQKLVISRALARILAGKARVLVAAQPTRGIDIRALRAIHDRLRAIAASGAGVLVLSSDLDELRSLCSKIHVLSRGRFKGAFPPEASDEELGRAMLGATS